MLPLKFKRHAQVQSGGLGQIAVVPLIDVTFQLLIFFVLTFAFQSSSDVKLPKAITSDIIKEENFNITVTSENVIYWNNKVVTIKELRQELSRPVHKNSSILIKADRRSSMGRVVDIWDLCRELGIEKINIATNQEK